ncbi:hypothetical protein B0T16DRAFT_318132 [Cercophora newfieldiana]|uniref:Uncharacterized protein n=1 Tax=Cercophora newfieldiana TaxID=92897 RepID=A0AA39YQM7_9PEZI|nr:hypothetical protein B0T16DRAFT_318132 [Cercophora newfieldiana]
MPIRNPFARRTGAATLSPDENSRPGSATAEVDSAHPGFERVDTVGSKASSALSIRSRRSQDTGEYKMSVVDDSGVYLPPSPVEKEAMWPRRYLSRASSDAKSSSGEIEHFSISRESFDSYRRSFVSFPFEPSTSIGLRGADHVVKDISAKSPIVVVDSAPRGSLDSSRFPRLPRSTLGGHRFGHFGHEPPTPEESFEDVGLNDENKPNPEHTTKKRGFFSKFGSDAAAEGTPVVNTQSMSRFLPGRKRGHSGQGDELMPVNGVLQEQEVQA